MKGNKEFQKLAKSKGVKRTHTEMEKLDRVAQNSQFNKENDKDSLSEISRNDFPEPSAIINSSNESSENLPSIQHRPMTEEPSISMQDENADNSEVLPKHNGHTFRRRTDNKISNDDSEEEIDTTNIQHKRRFS